MLSSIPLIIGFCIIAEIAFGSMFKPPIPESPPPLIIPGNPPNPAIPPIGFKGAYEADPGLAKVEELLPPAGAGASAFF